MNTHGIPIHARRMIRTGRVEWHITKPLARLYSNSPSAGSRRFNKWETIGRIDGAENQVGSPCSPSNLRPIRYFRMSKLSKPISPSSPAPSASSSPTHSSVDHYPKTAPSHYSLRSFFSKFTDQDHSHQQDQKSSNFSHEEQSSPVGLFGKLRQLTKLYGSAALVVYGVLGGVDFGLSFVTIYLVGAEHVRKAEDWLLEQLNWKRAHSTPLPSTTPVPQGAETENNMLWTTAVVAYTIHKTILLPFRIGLTAWMTPPIVRLLRKRGWKVGRNLG
ncbi:hypothetical protein PTTG_12210 [Puccinia triticina 1-1 BBBD Race 1]|uniref:DUF1279 domain-containing protein n=2 Tax=Puccinia triticina TaxID=208348 RepID=A0A180G8N2_PUCT1|nr:uncharacterized protein PtA15_1A355 [Puccinia triticina]OAV88960.1 hypothetical protein PTTG_12210 [Puccinia triticina 1-1 BBBD Race 1]WAQ81017.1 hypothetical protein PtA15_1A355 [Puccinia triticina]